jgi:hypothetical protein
MASPDHVPQNAEEAAYLSFALIDALAERLVTLRVMDQATHDAVYQTAAMVLEHTPIAAANRAAEFLRRTRLSHTTR